MKKYDYVVYVDDNFHYMDEDERYELGEFSDCASAVAACKEVVDRCLQDGFTETTTVAELLNPHFQFDVLHPDLPAAFSVFIHRG